jgi:hypothetical protein
MFCTFLFTVVISKAQNPIEWNFNTAGDKENWNVINANYEVKNGCLYFYPTAKKAWLTIGASMNATNYKHLTIRLKNTDINGESAISFRSSSAPNITVFNDPYVFDISIRDRNFKEYTIDLSEAPYWKGTIFALQLELPANPSIGSAIIIDQIKVTPTAENITFGKKPVANILDSLSIVNIYTAFKGDSWSNRTNWLSDECLNSWEGLDLDYNNYDFRVSRISLANNNLSQNTVCMDDLAGLKYLNLDGNNLSDLSFLYDLRNMDTLSVKNNKLNITQLIELKKCVSTTKSSFQYVPQSPFSLQTDGTVLSAINAGSDPGNIYAWYDDSNTKVYEITGSPLYTPPTEGNYYVRVTNPKLPGLVLTSQYGGSGISDVDANSINVYPNPATDFLHIDNAKDSQILLYAISGQLIFHKLSGSEHEKISLSGIHPGIYHLTIKTSGRSELVSKHKIIIR